MKPNNKLKIIYINNMNHPYDKSQNPTEQQFKRLTNQLQYFKSDKYPTLMTLFNDTGLGVSFADAMRAIDKLTEALKDLNRYEVGELIQRLDKGDKTAILQVTHFLDYEKEFILDKMAIGVCYN